MSTQVQNKGINEVAGAINTLDNMTQQNAALVEQATAASQSMAQQSKRLAEKVSTFKL